MKRRKLPIGIQHFRTIREDDYYYVDKTNLIHQLVNEGRHYFLSRPRRFGKSLLLDTIGSLFEGHEELFRGLSIHKHWDWTVSLPVVRLSFDAKYNKPGDLERSIHNQLVWIEEQSELEIESVAHSGPEHLQDLLRRLHRKTGQPVVVLIDEYDKPILDVLDNPQLAKENRDYLRGLYGMIKDCAEHVQFVFVAGISMFATASLFSGLNNLCDITLNPHYATICGFTDQELDEVFAPELVNLDRDKIRHWYNGYHWLGQERVYNPFGVLLLFKEKKFKPHWFQTGSPKFLFQVLMEKEFSPIELENLVADVHALSKFDVDDIGVEALLFQAGYLTIAEEFQRGFSTFYRLRYPNFEVQQSLNEQLLSYLGKNSYEVYNDGQEFRALLKANDFTGFGKKVQSFLASVPYPWHSNVGRYEAWYAGMLYACFRAIDLELQVEEASSRGLADMVVFHGGQVFVMEFKVVEDESEAESAMAAAISQMRERGYGDKYRDRGNPIHLLGLEFEKQDNTLLTI